MTKKPSKLAGVTKKIQAVRDDEETIGLSGMTKKIQAVREDEEASRLSGMTKKLQDCPGRG